MKHLAPASEAIVQYIAAFPESVQTLLKKVHAAIAETAPEAEEAFKYRIPTFTLDGKNLVHYAGFEKHIGFYPTPSGIVAFEKQLAKYPTAKGSIQFPLERPVPFDLIREIVKFRVKEVLNANPARKKK